MKLYKIRDWDRLYENNRSRSVSSLNWVLIPNRHDGETFTNIMAQTNAAEIYAGWILLIQIASKCTPRGTLIKGSGSPHDVRSLSVKCRADVRWLSASIEYLEKNTDWLEVVEIQDMASSCQAPDVHLAGGCQTDVRPVTSIRHEPDSLVTSGLLGQIPSEEGKNERKNERKNEVQNTHVKKEMSPSAPMPPRSSGKPDLESAKLYAAKIGLPSTEFNRWQNHYESNGWKVGRNPMKSFEGSLRNWKIGWEERRGYPAGKTFAEKEADGLLRKIDAI